MGRDITNDIFEGQPKPETVARFFQALAQSIVSWQRVEYAMHEIAKIAVSPKLPGAFSAGFHALQHTNSQLRYTDSALDFWFVAHSGLSHDLKTQWNGGDKPSGKGLYHKINSELSTRNCLAHFSAITEPQIKAENQKMYLEPSFLDTRYLTGTRKKSRYSVSDIAAAGTRFISLSKKMRIFAVDMGHVEAQLKG